MKIHWLAFTVHSNHEAALELWKMFFAPSLGDMVATERKGRGFEHISVAMNEAKLYYQPLPQKDLNVKDYYHIELPGSACDAIHPHVYQDVFKYLHNAGVRVSVTRIDVAWDDCPWEVYDFFTMVSGDCVTSLAKRESISLIQSPFQVRQNGEVGTNTCYFGSRESQRFLRCYDERGGTRLELVCKDGRADVVAWDLFTADYEQWEYKSKAHLLQYIRFDEHFGSWHEFMQDIEPTDIKVSSARVVSIHKMKSWFERQVVVALSVYYDVWGRLEADNHLRVMMKRARKKDRSRYAAVLQLANNKGRAGVSAFARHVELLGVPNS